MRNAAASFSQYGFDGIFQYAQLHSLTLRHQVCSKRRPQLAGPANLLISLTITTYSSHLSDQNQPCLHSPRN
jgi:hypothetical protein